MLGEGLLDAAGLGLAARATHAADNHNVTAFGNPVGEQCRSNNLDLFGLPACMPACHV